MAPSSVTRTLRLDRDLGAFLSAAAEREGVSPSFLVNRALRKFVEWDAFADKFGIVSLPSAFVSRLMDLLTDDQARELGSWVGREHMREFLTFWFKEVTPRTVVKGYPRLAAKYEKAFEYEEREEGGRWTIVFKHGGGSRWSIYYCELLKALFREILKTEAVVESTENQVVATFHFS